MRRSAVLAVRDKPRSHGVAGAHSMAGHMVHALLDSGTCTGSDIADVMPDEPYPVNEEVWAEVEAYTVDRILNTMDIVGKDCVVSEVAILLMASRDYEFSTTLLTLGVSHPYVRTVCLDAWQMLEKLLVRNHCMRHEYVKWIDDRSSGGALQAYMNSLEDCVDQDTGSQASDVFSNAGDYGTHCALCGRASPDISCGTVVMLGTYLDHLSATMSKGSPAAASGFGATRTRSLPT